MLFTHLWILSMSADMVKEKKKYSSILSALVSKISIENKLNKKPNKDKI